MPRFDRTGSNALRALCLRDGVEVELCRIYSLAEARRTFPELWRQYSDAGGRQLWLETAGIARPPRRPLSPYAYEDRDPAGRRGRKGKPARAATYADFGEEGRRTVLAVHGSIEMALGRYMEFFGLYARDGRFGACRVWVEPLGAPLTGAVHAR